MGGSKKRKRNKQQEENNDIVYSESQPDFAHLAILYPSFKSFVQPSPPHMRLTIDWTDFNATRELTRILLHHRHTLTWWIPDGQLCPTVPNRSNYIHWLEHLLSSNIIPGTISSDSKVRGFDIGTGASCIYPLLGASLHGWSFVGSDVTDVAIEWAEKNVSSNPHIYNLIEIRRVQDNNAPPCMEVEDLVNSDQITLCKKTDMEVAPLPLDLHACENKSYRGPPILVGVVRDDEKFDFCMCNPPFFESLEEAGLNPKTACGGTSREMVVHFNGWTYRWGLAWSFLPPVQKSSISLSNKKNTSFTLEGLQRQHGAINVLESVKSHFSSYGLSCSLNTSSFTVDVAVTKDDCDSILRNELTIVNDSTDCQPTRETSNESSLNFSLERLCFRISVFQQIPGTLLVKGSLQDKDSPLSDQVAAPLLSSNNAGFGLFSMQEHSL
ncbi:hypothetical protein V8G54_000311 [Vigna mungo]|uniref:U6 small nuclear RNA (adenine-(43)-N(6))-methyltransferase n=1 Tax=Vigna mungo TaxID=3915 RepID=A0AAQ3S8V0_VIGMU